MSPKRLDRVAPPSVPDEWDVRFGTSEAAKGWDALCTHARSKTREAYEQMRANPRPGEDATHYQLRGELSMHTFGGRELEQWQIKVSSSGRVWYLIDDDKHTAWLTRATPASKGNRITRVRQLRWWSQPQGLPGNEIRLDGQTSDITTRPCR